MSSKCDQEEKRDTKISENRRGETETRGMYCTEPKIRKSEKESNVFFLMFCFPSVHFWNWEWEIARSEEGREGS